MVTIEYAIAFERFGYAISVGLLAQHVIAVDAILAAMALKLGTLVAHINRGPRELETVPRVQCFVEHFRHEIVGVSFDRLRDFRRGRRFYFVDLLVAYEADDHSVALRVELHESFVVVFELLTNGQVRFGHVEHIAVPNRNVRIFTRLGKIDVVEFDEYFLMLLDCDRPCAVGVFLECQWVVGRGKRPAVSAYFAWTTHGLGNQRENVEI